ncbi:MMPL family transporter [Candidatus Woesearchaeota archaeon]|nr:MMPL family transporter [Candidatus Woesearchaeota archaeon]
MGKYKRMLTNFRVLVLFACLLLGIFAVYPNPWNEGVAIKGVAKNSSAEATGIQAPKGSLAPMQFEVITAINNKPLANLDDYYALVNTLKPNQTIRIKTNKNTYSLTTTPKIKTTTLNQTEITYVNETREINQTINGSTTTINKTFTKKIEQPKVKTEVLGIEPLGLTVADAPTSNLRKGLDLQGGTRAVLKPVNATPELVGDVIDTLKERLNVYGLSDIVVTEVRSAPAGLGTAESYILVEIAGATQEEILRLIGSQGKFEAKISNQTVFIGGRDITYVCKTAQCSGIDPNRGCGQFDAGYNCGFMFSITLSPEAAQKQADLTDRLDVVGDSLSDQIVLYLDDQEVDRLNIAADLKGRAITDIAITGSGQGSNEQQALQNALDNMKRLQTILKTGSLPVKIEIVRIDTISPVLGKGFLTNALTVGLLSLIAVSIIIMIAYRRLTVAIPIMFTALSEIFLTLALAALIGWNIDLAAVAGIIIAVGTGVNDQIIITDETIQRETDGGRSWKDRLKRAFGIIMSAYFTICVAMIPLFFAGAGLLKGFAVTTILAVSIGVFITRPAYAAIVQSLVEE